MSNQNEIKHTPGEWRFEPLEEDVLDVASDLLVKSHAEGSSVCIARVFDSADFPCLDDADLHKIDLEARANAYLMAAAPDLLRLAENHKNTLEVFIDFEEARERRDYDFIAQLRANHEATCAVLAKAKGESCASPNV